MKFVESPTLPYSPWSDPVKIFATHNLEAEDALRELVVELVARTDIEKVICFARRICWNTSISSFDLLRVNAQCHYFLLVVTESIERQEHLLQDYVNAHFKLGKVTLIAHGKETVNQAMVNGSRFFNYVFLYGKMLYSRTGLIKMEPYIEPELEMIFEKTSEQFEYNLNLAEGFHQAAGAALDQENYIVSMFLMHQAMEQGLSALIKLFTGYRADIHSLGRLQDLCLCFCEEEMLFPRKREEEQLLFQLLQKSYSGARYKKDFEVKENDVQRIYNEVAAFLRRVEERCDDKFAEWAELIEHKL